MSKGGPQQSSTVRIGFLSKYIHSLSEISSTGVSTELSYRAPLAELLHSIDNSLLANNEPRRTEYGAPDYVILRNNTPIGYIETKDIGENLDKIEKSEQIQRYKESLGNLIVTDYLEFRWFVEGEKRSSVKIASRKGSKIVPFPGYESEVIDLLDCFANEQTRVAKDPKDLAQRMGKIALVIRNTILSALQSKEDSALKDQMKTFHSRLIKQLSEAEFADMYAQTICYGLFAARANHSSGEFTRKTAGFEVPKTNPFLRRLFNTIAGTELDDRVTWAVDNLAYLLDRADFQAILKDFGKKTKHEDPVIHFYETFLASYDSKIREKKGVYYTPDPVVKYLVKTVDYILRNKKYFGFKGGLANSDTISKNSSDQNGEESHRIQILDPAVGTGTFLFEVIKMIKASFQGNEGQWKKYVPKHLLPRIFGFELLMAPYAIAHLKIGLYLKETGYDFEADDRLRIFLTNTLEESVHFKEEDIFDKFLVNESREAGEIKENKPIAVILGNPPYFGESKNNGDWIYNLLHKGTGNYFEFGGKPLNEKNPKWLNDDYVKFIRFSQWKIEQNGEGILAFITNHAYLDNPTFRGMRESLRNTFDDIYILDLHGNSGKAEKQKDGSSDQNVFEIAQGVALSIFIKKKNGEVKEPARIFYSELLGDRETKYKWLREHDLSDTNWNQIEPSKDLCLFVPQDSKRRIEYEKYPKITEIMPSHSVGLLTARDKLTIHFTPEEVWKTIIGFSEMETEEARVEFQLGEDVRDWKVSYAQKDLLDSGPNKKYITKILYRPFDYRYTYYTGKTKGFLCYPRKEIMKHLLQNENLALITSRMTKGENFAHALVTDLPGEVIGLSPKTSNNAFFFPLYLVGDDSGLFTEKSVNFSKEFLDLLHSKDISSTHEEVFYYIFSILYSSEYRKRYAEFLKRDFPRIPITSNKELFRKLSKYGEKIVSLQLMQNKTASKVKFPVSGDTVVDKLSYEIEKERVWINSKQYFAKISNEVWEYKIGGYQVCEKWLNDRKGRSLSFQEILHYSYIPHSIESIIKITGSIDKTISEYGKFPFV
ncbi:type ISP restriction/modification enzyme [Leptospira licerasiae]|uniref:site-specific DNA-methyltransferase (adenine-specific) n=1 Tax=Leptospira licerasiae str. MMD4847 TaxID=1049971 RepID=A0ABN0H4U6_9LEPT|nr:type ISP restriction/modification enzyme [Leptospira licerasiae]EIE03150.1 N-6 DNA Methylase domain protein [Leptospira licerasiae serovar Varillal str. VAR 010]EJZ40339.1 N-6 DNA Methylase domain protein [Leptospira licerasiae str. MMD4847]